MYAYAWIALSAKTDTSNLFCPINSFQLDILWMDCNILGKQSRHMMNVWTMLAYSKSNLSKEYRHVLYINYNWLHILLFCFMLRTILSEILPSSTPNNQEIKLENLYPSSHYLVRKCYHYIIKQWIYRIWIVMSQLAL